MGEGDLSANEGAANAESMKRCPDCAELVQPDARICRFCGFNFEAPHQDGARTRPTVEQSDALAPVGSSPLSRFSSLAWLGIAAAGAMLIGAFGPWGKAVGLLNVSISGTDGSNDGWFVVVAALVGAGAMLAYTRGTRLAALGVVLAGAVGVAVTYYDRGNITDASEANTSNLVSLQVGWGLNLAMGASAVLGIVGLVALLGNQEAPGMMKP